MALLGIDLGTTACKAVAYDDGGRVLAKARREYKILRPRSQWAEVDPDDLFRAVKSVIFEINQSCTEKIRAIGFSSQGEGVVPLDRDFKPLGNIILSYDGRSLAQTERLGKVLGEDFLFGTGGQILASMGTATKIMWMLDNPSYYPERPSYFACVGDYAVSCFGCPPAIDYSLASRTMLFDVHKLRWSQPVLDAVGIEETMMSKVQKAGSIVDRISSKAAEELGLSPDTVIVTGGHDQPCAMLGTGATGKGEAAYSLGTTETLICSMDSFYGELKKYGLPCYPHIVENKYVTLPGNFTGGIILQWYKEQFADLESKTAGETNTDAYDIIMSEVDEVPSKLLVLPHFTVTGSPYNDSQSMGAIFGLHLDTKKGEFIRGLLEGVTYEILLNLMLLKEMGIQISALRTVGGGTKSGKILQLKSDILGIPLYVPRDTEAPCKGAALLAAKAVGLVDDIESAWKEKEENIIAYFPIMEHNNYYKERFEKYRLLYPMIKNLQQKK